jgi:hypothetical protein
MVMPMVLILLFSNGSSLSLLGGLDGVLDIVQLLHFSNRPAFLLQQPINSGRLHVTAKLNQRTEYPIGHCQRPVLSQGTNQTMNSGLVTRATRNITDDIVIQVFNQLGRGQLEFVGFHCVFPLLDVSSLVVVASPVHTVPFVPVSLNQYIFQRFGLVVGRQLFAQANDQKDLT